MADCNCPGICPDSEHCIAIYIHDTGECWVCCSQDQVTLEAYDATPKDLTLDSKVDLDMGQPALLYLAQALDMRFDGEILVPAWRADEVVQLREKELTVRELVERLGLIARASDDFPGEAV